LSDLGRGSVVGAPNLSRGSYVVTFSLAANFSRIFFTLGETVNMQYGWLGWFLK
jgi:hypothetical protein